MTHYFSYPAPAPGDPPAQTISCPGCGADLTQSALYRRYRLCDACRFHFRLGARERIGQLADPDSFQETHRTLASVDPLAFADRLPYRQRLRQARQSTGLAEAAVTGIGRLGGRPAVFAVLDFNFLGGSMGSAVGEKVTLAFELALKRRLPVITVAASGGARVQEGLLALMQMAKTATAAARLHDAGLPFLSVLGHPTTGGVYASFAALGDILIAEPGALLSFAGPRVAEQTAGQRLPAEERTAEAFLRHGQVDIVADRARLRPLLITLLELLSRPYELTMSQRAPVCEPADDHLETAWQTVQLARHHQRPTALDYIARLTTSFAELHGDRAYADDPSIVCGLGDLSGQAVVIVGQERGHGAEAAQRNEGRARPEGYRKAQRVMRLAAKFGLPVVTFIDTPGADVALESEQRGLAGAIAHGLALMSALPTPVVSVVIGEGGSGGALALGLADRVLMLENAVYSVISPEGGAAILYGDAGRAEEVAPALKITAHDAKALGVVDAVIPEPEGGAHRDPDTAAQQIKGALLPALLEVQAKPLDKLLKERRQRFRRLGRFAPTYRIALAEEFATLVQQLRRPWAWLRQRLVKEPGAGSGEEES